MNKEDHSRVNRVSPSLIHTGFTQHYQKCVFKIEAGRTPVKRIAPPSDVTNADAFLVSNKAEFLTGVNLFATGRQVMY